MVRHRLIPCGIVGQISYAQAKLLRDESGEIMGYRSPVAYQLREGDARMPHKGELQRDAQPVPSLPPRADDLNVRRPEGIEPGQMVPIGRDREDLAAPASGPQLMRALFYHASFPHQVKF